MRSTSKHSRNGATHKPTYSSGNILETSHKSSGGVGKCGPSLIGMLDRWWIVWRCNAKRGATVLASCHRRRFRRRVNGNVA